MNNKQTFMYQKILVTVSYVVMLLVNVLSNVLMLGGVTTEQVSQRYSNLFTPAGYTFAIWGVIYALLLLYILAMWGLLPRKKISADVFCSINYWVIALNLLNACWILAWHYDLILLSVVIILGMLACLIFINNCVSKFKLTNEQKWFTSIPFAVYLAWIIVATVANITALLVSLDWNGWGLDPSVWTVIIIIFATIISLITALKLNSIAVTVTFLWALIGILVAQLTTQSGQYLNIIITLSIAITLTLIVLIYQLYKRFKKPKAKWL